MSTAPKLAVLPAGPPRLEPGDILTPQELAKRLKVPISWVYKHVDDVKQKDGTYMGRLPVLRCGHYLRFSWPEVVEWLRNGKG